MEPMTKKKVQKVSEKVKVQKVVKGETRESLGYHPVVACW